MDGQPVLVVDEVPQSRHVPFCGTPEVLRHFAFPEEVGFPVAHALDKADLLWKPCIQSGGPDFGDIDTQ